MSFSNSSYKLDTLFKEVESTSSKQLVPVFKKPNQEKFHFYKLPDLVREKILKEYIPISDKVRLLSQMDEFKSYYENKHLWFEPTRRLFDLFRFIKSGWHIDFNNLNTRYYFSADYLNLSLTVYTFCLQRNNSKLPAHIGPFQKNLSQLPVFLNKMNEKYSTLTAIEEREVLVYHYVSNSFYWPQHVYFFILQFQKKVFWSRDKKYYPLKNNTCVIPNGLDKLYHIVLKLYVDLTVQLYKVKYVTKYIRLFSSFNLPHKVPEATLLPLTFQLCNENFSSYQKRSSCNSCENDPNYLHVICRQTLKYTDKNNVSISITHFFQNQTFYRMKHMCKKEWIFPDNDHWCLLRDLSI